MIADLSRPLSGSASQLAAADRDASQYRRLAQRTRHPAARAQLERRAEATQRQAERACGMTDPTPRPGYDERVLLALSWLGIIGVTAGVVLSRLH